MKSRSLNTLRDERELSEDSQWGGNAFNEQGIINPYSDWERTSYVLTSSWWAHLFSFKCSCLHIPCPWNELQFTNACHLPKPLFFSQPLLDFGSGKRLHYHISRAWGKSSCWQPCRRCRAKGGNTNSFLMEGRRTHGRLPGAFPVPLLGTACAVVVLDWSVWWVVFLED